MRQRVWAAQAAVLLPLVNEMRVRLIPHCRRCLTLPIEIESGRWVYDPLDLEVGQLARYLDRADIPRRLKQHVRWLRDVRNKVAHMEPLEPEEILDPMLVSDL